MFKPYITTGIREENDGRTVKIFEEYEVSKWGKFVNWLLGEERYIAGDLCRMVYGYLEEEE